IFSALYETYEIDFNILTKLFIKGIISRLTYAAMVAILRIDNSKNENTHMQWYKNNTDLDASPGFKMQFGVILEEITRGDKPDEFISIQTEYCKLIEIGMVSEITVMNKDGEKVDVNPPHLIRDEQHLGWHMVGTIGDV